MSAEQETDEIRLSVTNVGGIDRTSVEMAPGVTILEGRNATNRTSFLQSIMAVLGSDDVSLKGDADEGLVELSVGDRTYTRTLERKDGAVVTSGDPYLDDPELADLFAFLLESNEARRAVARGDDLRELIMEPVDTDAIQAEIRDREAEKRRLDDELDDLESLKRDLPGLEGERNRLESDIEDKRAALEATETELEAADADIDETRQEKAELEEKFAELRDVRTDLEDARFDIETQEESLDSLRAERRELEAERDELPDAPMGEVEEIDARIERLRDRKRSLDSETSDLQRTIQFNEELLDGGADHVLASPSDDARNDGAGEDSVTDRLLDDSERVTCWTCGSEVERDQIDSTLDHLRELRQEKLDDAQSVEQRLADLSDRKSDLEDQQRRRDRIERKLGRAETEIEDREANLTDLRDRRDALTDEVGDLETEIEALEDREYREILDLHKETNQLEFELGTLESDLEDVVDEINAIERRLEQQDRLESQREEVQAELDDLRTQIDRIEAQAVSEFNDHMDAVLDILDYSNLERIWIERTQREVREGRRTVSKSAFDLHVVRQSDSGATYEDTVGHLSESEREVTGLVFALAGYLVHEVYETVPFMLLDSLEAVDSGRIAKLVDYLRTHAEYLVVALLSEDAAALTDEYRRVTDI
ncbi:archaea-specific SMC-related protein [Halorussus amylolyticus]|uniref:archaea-specific SMC-related protein n=1 Tax=Halorussus amylolyticus TaxID=1126242 RepID=UPI00104E43B9|nr:archaea-specific SMC-related protein [Halorussus amylolyticus]